MRLQPSCLFLNTRFVEVHFDRQRPGFLTFLCLLQGDGDHGAEVVRVDLVHVLQKLFIPIDTQLKDREKNNQILWSFTNRMVVELSFSSLS